jgi:hypothetical protein
MRKNHILGLLLLAAVVMFMPARSSAQISVGLSVHIGPPALPVYEQPICPSAGYLWAPGYWAYGADGYYWVPGTWVMAPSAGLLWTPGYWGWGGGAYMFHAGYWGPHVGFYGGINYGFGYGGVGFGGGRWNGGVFAYNTAVMHVNTTVIHNTYVDKTVVNVSVNNHVSFNGGTGGVAAQPTAEERAAENEHHVAATESQTQHEHAASTNRALLASENHGKPAIAATSKPGEFSGHGVVAAHEAAAVHTSSPNNGNKPPSNAANVKTDRPPSATTASATSKQTNTSSTANAAHTTSSTSQNKPASKPASKPKAASKPAAKETKPHKD